MERRKATPKERQSKREVISELSRLGTTLLDSAVTHTSVWKRATFEIPKEQTQEFFGQVIDSPIGEMLTGLKGYKQREGSDKPHDFETIQLDCTNPEYAVLSVESFGPYGEVDKYHSINFNIVFLYGKNGEGYYLKTTLTNHVQEGFAVDEVVIKPYNYWILSSSSYQPEMAETGYEGSDSKHEDNVTKAQLQLFLKLFSDKTNGTQIKEKTMSQQMAEMKMVNADTNQTFYFDPERGDFFDREGMPMNEDRSPLANLPSEGVLKVTAQYLMSSLEEGEKNPFLKD